MEFFNKTKAYKMYHEKVETEIEFFEENGVTSEMLDEIMLYSKEQFLKDCVYYTHNIPLEAFNNEMGEGMSPLLKKYRDKLITEIDFSKSSHSGWIKEISDERILYVISKLSAKEITILTEIAINRRYIIEVAEMVGYTRQWTAHIYHSIIDELKKALLE